MDKSETTTEWIFSKTHSSVQCVSDRSRGRLSSARLLTYAADAAEAPVWEYRAPGGGCAVKVAHTQDSGEETAPGKHRFRAGGWVRERK